MRNVKGSLSSRLVGRMPALLLLAAIAMVPAAKAGAAGDCSALRWVTFSPPGDATSISIDSAALVLATPGLPEHCHVLGHLDTEIGFEMRLPTSWNHKLLELGSPGYAGTVASLTPYLGRGYAMVGTNTGHKAAPGDATWALNRPDRVTNYAYRGVHLATLAAKLIVDAYYGTPPLHAYFQGCSNAGREAMVEVERYPEDFDGVIAGDPAIDLGGKTVIEREWNAQAVFPDPSVPALDPTLPARKLPLLARLVVAKCDAPDVAFGGLVDNPVRCDFSPEKDLPPCPGDVETADCFTSSEIRALQELHRGPHARIDGRDVQLGSGFYFSGGESDPGVAPGFFSWANTFTSSTTGNGDLSALRAYLDYLVLDTPTAPLPAVDFSSFPQEWLADASLFDATDPDISNFNSAGGKLIIYQGWSDPVVAPLDTLKYYDELEEQEGGGVNRLRDHTRLFMVPGMLHCSGGPGPYNVDFLSALEAWQEQGLAPDSVVGANPASGLTRPVCAYPDVARLLDPSSDPTNPASYDCVRLDEERDWDRGRSRGDDEGGSH